MSLRVTVCIRVPPVLVTSAFTDTKRELFEGEKLSDFQFLYCGFIVSITKTISP